MKRLSAYLLVLSILSLACRTLQNLQSPTERPPSTARPTDIFNTEATEVSPTQEPLMIADMEAKLKELNGEPCRGNPDFICVTITVPLDHFDSANPETIDVVFAV